MKEPRQHRRKPAVLKSLLVLVLLCGGVLADSNLRIVTTEYVLNFPALPEAFDGFRIVQLSDVHGIVFGKNNDRLFRAVRAARPDLIALTGDLADRDTDLADIDTLLSGLEGIAPLYYVSGNHEWNARLIGPLQNLFSRHGVRYLRNEYVLLERGGAQLVLAGVEDPNGWAEQPTPEEVAAALPEDGLRVLLAHRNYWVRTYPDLPVDLILCGHAHGGIIRLPGIGGLLDHQGKLFAEYDCGVYASGRYRMVVSRGVGLVEGIPRVLNNPEIVAVELRK